MKESLQQVHTIGTGVAVTFAVPLLAVGAGEVRGAVAHVAAREVLQAGAAVETRVVGAGHGADLAVLPVEALRAGARVLVHQVLAEKREGTGGSGRVRAHSGPLPVGSRRFRSLARSLAYLAAAAILAGVAVALVGLDLAVDAGEAGLARARVAALACVGARGLVLARLVIGAVVEV